MLALLVWIVVRYHAGANPAPSKVHHNTLLEVAWTMIPVIILVVIAIPSFRLLYFEAAIPKPDVHHQGDRQAVVLDLRISGRQRRLHLSTRWACPTPTPRRRASRACWASTIIVVVPVNKVVEVDTTGADVIHSWALPADGREDGRRAGPHQPHLVQGRPQTGTFYGQCSELCGARHAFMPIEVQGGERRRIRRLACRGEEEVRRARRRRHPRRGEIGNRRHDRSRFRRASRRPSRRRPRHHPTGWRRYVYSTNHKDIGTMYLIFAIVRGPASAASSR